MKAQTSQKTQKIMNATKCYKDFPKPGLNFLDIFPISGNPQTLQYVMDIFAKHLQAIEYDKLFMLESRGFLFGVPLSLQVKKPCYPIRKKGKLPGATARQQYKLQYGQDAIQIQKQSIKQGDKIVIVDDVLATGGTLNAAIQLIEKQGGHVVGILLVSIVEKLNGLDKLSVPKERVFYIYDI